MKTYAFIHNGIVWEIINQALDAGGNEIPISQRFSPEYVSSCVDITDLIPRPKESWTYDGKDFAASSLS